MAPAAVQTKHSVDENTTSAGVVFTHSSIAGPGMPSLSPMIITFVFSLNIDMPTLLSLLLLSML